MECLISSLFKDCVRPLGSKECQEIATDLTHIGLLSPNSATWNDNGRVLKIYLLGGCLVIHSPESSRIPFLELYTVGVQRGDGRRCGNILNLLPLHLGTCRLWQSLPVNQGRHFCFQYGPIEVTQEKEKCK